jgi:ribulose-5-phosphate 4-epimerase/fuculose-1-phosphate aldolase
MILENHGALVCGTTIAEAYIYHHFFELACRAQIGALAGGVKLKMPSRETCVERARKFGRIGAYDSKSRDWVASMALVEKHHPDYRS